MTALPRADIEPARDAPALSLRRVRVVYPGAAAPALDIESLEAVRGERIAVIGPSGAGKTTLLRLIAGLVRADAGSISVLGQDLAASAARQSRFRRRVGLVFQEFNLIERASVFDNVLWGRLGRMNPVASVLGLFGEDDRAAASKAIAEVGLEALADQRCDRLSGGQKQRVAVARALAQEPDIICADEPVSNLDPVATAGVMALLAEASRRRGATLVMVVHHPALAREHALRIVGLARGHIVFDGPAQAADDKSVIAAIYGTGALTDGARDPRPAPFHLA